jgi:hypothetical protein
MGERIAFNELRSIRGSGTRGRSSAFDTGADPRIERALNFVEHTWVREWSSVVVRHLIRVYSKLDLEW